MSTISNSSHQQLHKTVTLFRDGTAFGRRNSLMNTAKRLRIRAIRDGASTGSGKFGKQRRIIFPRIAMASETGRACRRVNLIIEFYAIARRYKSWRIRWPGVTCLHLSYIPRRHQRSEGVPMDKTLLAEERFTKPFYFDRFDVMDGNFHVRF